MPTSPNAASPRVPDPSNALLTISRKGWLLLPLWVFINGRPLGLLRNKSVTLEMSPGTYEIGICIWGRIIRWEIKIGGQSEVTLHAGDKRQVLITDRELWWNILFDIDLVLWIASLFYTLPSPYNWIYEVVSNGFFVIWLVRIILRRKRYFVLKLS